MVKIVSRKFLGMQPVYDIGVARDHNFLLANGQVASNCFNKSHSMAYGFVTYQTAYLKANYPVEYMAALLTAHSGDQDKVQMHIANCVSMGIEVLPPDINRSGIDFTPENLSILFGLSAVRNVGQGAIECILESRAEAGPFQSLADLCDRVDLRAVNRRALEALIQCGAFDLMNSNRNQLVHDLNFIIDWAQGRAKDREIGQGSLFDAPNGSAHAASSGFKVAPKAPDVADFEPQEKLRLEKELLGFYISDHPLKAVQRSARVLAPISLAELADQPEKVMISAIVMLSSVKPVVTKKGDRMAIVQVEDLTGQSEGVVFPRSYERIGQYIEADVRLMIWGKVDRRDDRAQLIIEDAEPIETVRLVMVELEPQIAADITYQHRLRTILQQQGDEREAKVPVVAIIGKHPQRQFVRLGAQFRVRDPEAAVAALTQADFKARSTPLVSA
ncbi:MAG: trans-splicing intein-formed DNA polymerase III subunit alpha C-terminal partner DnaE-C [Leptolyngbyaceae cyanobacterium SL_1_1]|nr:trans-splicing intein-formed DNA polymerase III subunit alpha C-terminal partner DnaE-C [Leptolyngbyaceae cyanobacterium RM2_2_21]NJN03456.1 trans-splicing intein-formed DNA polymerase III subunit alpha C-terminal partner DnaE-C [Leptolyngbyaceae cyanobacterium RM1_1_2]NJO08781.1 trans-splicing intein-formed DNA polymerase III subunit alpha C-terminal partner DnaE-C [Leptolyngbyaceae cyanobacterium SL_1_1]